MPVVTRDEVPFAKPDPEPFLAAAQRSGIAITNSVIVVDSIWDLLDARYARRWEWACHRAGTAARSSRWPAPLACTMTKPRSGSTWMSWGFGGEVPLTAGRCRKEKQPMASEGLHEPLELLDEATIDQHRARTSLCEEFEAIDWYDQRVKATSDASLAAVLAHNRDEEKEHAAMLLEWLRRHDPVLDKHLRTFLFTSEPITRVEAETMGAAPGPDETPGTNGSESLGIGSLKGAEQ